MGLNRGRACGDEEQPREPERNVRIVPPHSGQSDRRRFPLNCRLLRRKATATVVPRSPDATPVFGASPLFLHAFARTAYRRVLLEAWPVDPNAHRAIEIRSGRHKANVVVNREPLKTSACARQKLQEGCCRVRPEARISRRSRCSRCGAPISPRRRKPCRWSASRS